MLEALRHDRFTRWVFGLAVAFVLLQSQWEPTGHHDRARLATIEALVEHHTWSIEPSRYDTIDKIQHNGRLYASKPPMMPALMAVVYAVGRHATGRTFANAEWLVVKSLAVVCIGLPFLLFVLAWASLLRTFTDDPWTYRFCLVAGAFGNYVAGYAVIINNHSLAALALFFALYHLLMARPGAPGELWRLAASGFFAGLAPTFEFPVAVASVGLAVTALVRFGPRATFVAFGQGAALPLGLHFALNLLVTDGSLLPFYLIGDYHYPGSYWNNPQSFDTLAESRPFYAFNVLIGHHGVLSLTPTWLLSLYGAWRAIHGRDRRLRAAAWILLSSMAIALPWFIFKTSNYGGGAQGFRWLFWLTPLLLLTLIPGVARLRSGWAWGLACAALTFAVFNALYVAQSPWGQSSLHLIFNWAGVIDY